MRERVDELAVATTLEQGKTLAESRLEVQRACEIIEWDANEGRRVYGRVVPSEPGVRHMVLRQPIGVVSAHSPWNFPVGKRLAEIAGRHMKPCIMELGGHAPVIVCDDADPVTAAAVCAAGNPSINHLVASVPETPFGGVKGSGYGREGGTEGLECHTVVKNVPSRNT